MTDAPLFARETELGLEVRLHVQPRARRSEVLGVHGGSLKIRVTAPPVEDAANRAVVAFLAGFLGISRSRLCMLSGARSRDKTLRIRGMSLREFLDRLEA